MLGVNIDAVLWHQGHLRARRGDLFLIQTVFDRGEIFRAGHHFEYFVLIAHIFRAGVPLGDLKRIPADRVLCVQVNDAEAEPSGTLADDTMNRKLCGLGAFDLNAFVGTLDVMGVQVPLSVEIISPQQSERELKDAAAVSLLSARRCFDRI